jgi:hypothetical protein
MNFASKCASSLMHACKAQRFQRFAVLSMLLLAFSMCAFAQDATIVGTVTDPSGSVVPNATVTATNTQTVEKLVPEASNEFCFKVCK